MYGIINHHADGRLAATTRQTPNIHTQREKGNGGSLIFNNPLDHHEKEKPTALLPSNMPCMATHNHQNFEFTFPTLSSVISHQSSVIIFFFQIKYFNFAVTGLPLGFFVSFASKNFKLC